jgi:hypothetical protein
MFTGTAERLVTLSPRAKSICADHWQVDKRGRVGKDCCARCPLAAPCGTWHPTSWDGINDHVAALNAAAEVA